MWALQLPIFTILFSLLLKQNLFFTDSNSFPRGLESFSIITWLILPSFHFSVSPCCLNPSSLCYHSLENYSIDKSHTWVHLYKQSFMLALKMSPLQVTRSPQAIKPYLHPPSYIPMTEFLCLALALLELVEEAGLNLRSCPQSSGIIGAPSLPILQSLILPYFAEHWALRFTSFSFSVNSKITISVLSFLSSLTHLLHTVTSLLSYQLPCWSHLSLSNFLPANKTPNPASRFKYSMASVKCCCRHFTSMSCQGRHSPPLGFW